MALVIVHELNHRIKFLPTTAWREPFLLLPECLRYDFLSTPGTWGSKEAQDDLAFCMQCPHNNWKLVLNFQCLTLFSCTNMYSWPLFVHTICIVCQDRGLFLNRTQYFPPLGKLILTLMTMYHNIKENDSQHCPEQTSQWSVSFLTSNTRYMNPLSKTWRASVTTIIHSCELISSRSSKLLITSACSEILTDLWSLTWGKVPRTLD